MSMVSSVGAAPVSVQVAARQYLGSVVRGLTRTLPLGPPTSFIVSWYPPSPTRMMVLWLPNELPSLFDPNVVRESMPGNRSTAHAHSGGMVPADATEAIPKRAASAPAVES